MHLNQRNVTVKLSILKREIAEIGHEKAKNGERPERFGPERSNALKRILENFHGTVTLFKLKPET